MAHECLGNLQRDDLHNDVRAWFRPRLLQRPAASECGEVPMRGTKQLLYQIVIADVSDRA